MKKTLFEKLAKLEAKKKTLEARITIAREKVREEMEVSKADRVEAEYGVFFFAVRKKYQYSENVLNMETSLKSLKKAEEQNPATPFEESKVLTYRAANEE